MLSEKQQKMVQFSGELASNSNVTKEMTRLELEKKWKYQVYEGIAQLSETVDEQTILKMLPIMDVGSWNEVLEERFIGYSCGNSTCGNKVVQKTHQMYHIDRKGKKIYERSTEKHKFCSPSCHEWFLSIRSQLCAYPLWMTGETSDRIDKAYTLERTHELIHSGRDDVLTTIEIVPDLIVVNSLTDLTIRDRDDDSTAEESDDNEEEMERKKTDLLAENIKNFIKSDVVQKMESESTAPLPTKEPIRRVAHLPANPRLPDTQNTSTSGLKFSMNEDDKLQKLRSKYSRSAMMKAPIMVGAPHLHTKKVGEINRAQRVKTVEVVDYDGECVTLPSTSLIMDTNEPADTHLVDGIVESATSLLSSWWSRESVRLVEEGHMRSTNEIDRIMRMYMRGEHVDNELDSVKLPNVDFVGIKKRQSEILIQTLKPTWREMERKLGIKVSTTDLLSQLVTTFEVKADTIAGIEKPLLKIISIVLFRIICRLNIPLAEEYFPNDHNSTEVQEYLDEIHIEAQVYDQLCNHLLL